MYKFRKATGEAPLFTLLRIRLQLSKELILSGEKSIKEISDICGFSDEYHFSNSFKKFYGVAPTIYKKNAKK
ncbi:MAG: helix-turn-helix transcriptional regulator [Clostridia bacterium]|nr:helix-turn-helix transcriptional regulator [Clostridia bacterium]